MRLDLNVDVWHDMLLSLKIHVVRVCDCQAHDCNILAPVCDL